MSTPTPRLHRRSLDAVLFLGPATILLFLFFILPVLADVLIAFTDMDRTLRVTKLTTDQFVRMATRDSRMWDALLRTALYVFLTLTFFNVGFAVVLGLTTTAVPERLGTFFRAVWLLPRMSPSVVYALLWAWTIDPNERGLLNQVLIHVFGAQAINLYNQNPFLIIVLANGFIGASLGMVIFTSAIRSIPQHLFHAAEVDGAGPLAVVWHVVLPALRWPISYVTAYQTLSLMVSFEYIWLITKGGPFYDTTVFALYAYGRAFSNGQYAYGAALVMVLVAIGTVLALVLWRLMDMKRLLDRPRIEVH
jgi:inositol-phosphate transport system permease protein